MAENFSYHTCIVEGKKWRRFNDTCFKSTALDLFFLGLFDSALLKLVPMSHNQFRSSFICVYISLGSSFPPILIDAIL
jgi:hypothetical protein